MPTPEIKTVTQYISAQPAAARPALRKVRSAIRAAVPEAEESISYKIAAYKLDGAPVLYFAAWKNHYAVYPATKGVIAKFKNELAKHKLVKHTVQFSFEAPVPAVLIGRIAKFRAKENAKSR